MNYFLFFILFFISVSCDNDPKDKSCDLNCGENGVCKIINEKESCECEAGFNGNLCDVNIDDCVDNPCLNNGECKDKVDSYSCECKAGFSGNNCEIKANNCEGNPCLNNGKCFDLDDGYRCECKGEFSGNNCEIDKNNCTSLCQWGTSGDDKGYSMVIDKSDNIYITGTTDESLFIEEKIGEKDLFLIKIGKNGIKEWTKQWGTTKKEEPYSITTDSDNNIYITGFTSGSLDGNKGKNDAFLTKLNSDGDIQWTKQWGSDEDDYGNSIVIDSNNNIYITGNTSGSLDGVTEAQKRDIFLTKFNTNGELQWSKQWGDNYEWGKSVAFDSNNNIFITGYMGNVFNGDIFISKINPNGNREWIKKQETSENDYGNSIAIDSNDNIFVTGKTLASIGDGDGTIFLQKLDNSGKKIWTKQFGAVDGEGRDLVLDSEDNIFVIGTINKDKRDEDNNIILTKFSNDGKKLSTQEWDKGSNDFGFSIDINSKNDIYFTGFTNGSFYGFENQGYLDVFLIKADK